MFFNNSCYSGERIFGSLLSYEDSERLCTLKDPRAGLPSIHSLAELEFLYSLGAGPPHLWFGPEQGVYMGGLMAQGRLVWQDGTKEDFSHWQHPTGKQQTSCIAFFSSLYWKAIDCVPKLERKRGLLEDFCICKIRIQAETGTSRTYVYNIREGGAVKFLFSPIVSLILILATLVSFLFIIQHISCAFLCRCNKEQVDNKSCV